MSFLITQGLGNDLTPGSENTTILTGGLGQAMPPVTPGFFGTGIQAFAGYLEISFTSTPIISGPAADPSNYVIVPNFTGDPVTVTSLQIIGGKLRLITTEQTNGAVYTISIPFAGLTDISHEPYQGPATMPFTGVGIAPTALLARSIDSRIVEVVFSEAVVEAEATNPVNYGILPTLKVVSVVKVLDTIYRLTTARQHTGTLYTVTVSNIHDLSGNVI